MGSRALLYTEGVLLQESAFSNGSGHRAVLWIVTISKCNEQDHSPASAFSRQPLDSFCRAYMGSFLEQGSKNGAVANKAGT